MSETTHLIKITSEQSDAFIDAINTSITRLKTMMGVFYHIKPVRETLTTELASLNHIQNLFESIKKRQKEILHNETN